MILSHSLARLERMRSNLPPTGSRTRGNTVRHYLSLFWRVSLAALRSLRRAESAEAMLLPGLVIFSPLTCLP
jgi:hypothetical protein